MAGRLWARGSTGFWRTFRVVDPPRVVLDAMEKLHKIVDQRVLSIHGMVSYYPDKQAFDTWTLPDVVLARPSAPLIPVLKFVAGDLALDNRIKEALERPASPNLRTLMAFAPSIDEMLANSIYPGSPEVNLRLQHYMWTIANDYEMLVFRRGQRKCLRRRLASVWLTCSL